MKKKICIIGNNNFGGSISDGQRIKVRTYLEVLEKEGFDIFFVELEAWKKRIFKTISSIKRGIKACDIILIMAGPSGCRKIIPLVNFLNRKYKKRVVYSMIGTGTLSLIIRDKISFNNVENLFLNKKYELIQDKKFSKHLKRLDAIFCETNFITEMYKNVYEINNCYTVTNFRIGYSSERITKKESEIVNLLFLSRVMEEKGVLDLLNAIKKIGSHNYILNIYGVLDLDEQNTKIFNDMMCKNIRYCGVLKPDEVYNVFHQHDLFIFPTRFSQEGVPGVIVESLLTGTPVLSSNFGQAQSLLVNGVDSLLYNMYDVEDLKEKLETILLNNELRIELTKNAKKSGYKFTYDYVRKDFLKYLTGEDVE